VGKPTGFLEHPRRDVDHRPVEDRVRDFRELDVPHAADALREQASRCMDCGVPFCHSVGCPLDNRVPEFNDLVYRGRWREASEVLHSTNNVPEITGRLCPALCEASCTLNMQCAEGDAGGASAWRPQPVLIRHIEWQIVERAWQEGWITPLPPARRTGRRVAVVGSGPAGLAAAQQLARMGHEVTVFEKDARPGGLLRYGIPDFKLDKRVIDRRLAQLEAEGVHFQTDIRVGEDVSPRYLRKTHDAILLALGAGRPRELDVPGSELEGVVPAMDYLSAQNRRVAGRGEGVPPLRDAGILPARGEGVSPLRDASRCTSGLPAEDLTAAGKVVAVIGGGDTGSDCVGTAIRQGARQVHQLEILPQPPEGQNPATPWPNWPIILRTTTSHEEGCTRHWAVQTTRLEGRAGRVLALHAVRVQWRRGPKGMEMSPLAGTEFVLPVDLVIVAMGFLHVQHEGLVTDLGLELDPRGNIVARPPESDAAPSSAAGLELRRAAAAPAMTSVEGVFAAGDASRGASLIVHAISSGRSAADAIDRWLK
jgi:glutamate synthase (NADPH/NADH) small chain